MTKINTKDLSFGLGLKRGFAGSVGVSDARGNAVLVPADTLVFDCFFEAVFVVIETRGAGFHLDENDFLDALRVHASENEKVDWRTNEFRFSWAERKVGQIGGELLGEHAA
jgi:hypothetical protein